MHLSKYHASTSEMQSEIYTNKVRETLKNNSKATAVRLGVKATNSAHKKELG
jgi:hypothetical protein